MAELIERPGVARAVLLAEPEARRAKCVPGWLLAATASAATLLVATSLLAGAPRATGGGVVARNSLGEEVTVVQSKACSDYPSLKFKMPNPILHSNLGKKGPDRRGAEGIVYDAVVDLGGREQHVLLVVNATSSSHYKPFSPGLNGVRGQYGSINLQSGSNVDLRFRFYNQYSGDRYQLSDAAFTFFGGADTSVESVTLSNSYKHYHLTARTQVRVEDLGDRTRFSGIAASTAEDSPADPLHLTHQQKSRAVTVTFEHLDELQVTLGAGAGVGPRFFTFVGRPSLMCSVTVPRGVGPPLDDITALPPLQQSVQCECREPERFGTMLVSVGQRVKAGDGVFTVTRSDGSTKTYTTPIDGTVKAAQTALVSGDNLKTRLDDKTVAIIAKLQSGPLAGMATAKRAGGAEVEIGAEKQGTNTGDIEELEKLPRLEPNGKRGKFPSVFERWNKEFGDSGEEGDPVAVVENSVTGDEREILAESRGKAVKRQEALRKGNLIGAVMQDENFAVMGKSRPLHVGLRETGIDPRFNAFMNLNEEVALNRSCENNASDTDGCSTAARGLPWWRMGQTCGVILLCSVFCCFYCVMRKPLPPYAAMGAAQADSESEESVTPSNSSSEDEGGLRLDWEDEHKFSHTVFAKWRPLGIKHTFTAPIVVRDFTVNSYARQELGIKEGWKLTRVGGEELRDNPDFEEVSLEVHANMKEFPLWPLALEFSEELESDDRKTIKFLERPIGIIFKNQAPIEVEQVFEGSPAADAGVEVGWFVRKIADFQVTSTTTFAEAIAAFKEAVAALDDRGNRYGSNNNKSDNNKSPGQRT